MWCFFTKINYFYVFKIELHFNLDLKKFSNEILNYIIEIRMLKFEKNCLKTIGGDRFLMKLSFCAFLVCTFHKEPFEVSDFDPWYLKNYFRIWLAVQIVSLNFYKIKSICKKPRWTLIALTYNFLTFSTRNVLQN